jgi:hypothetical protein
MNVEREISLPFALETSHAIRVRTSPDTMLVVAHHIICDLTTLKILLNEVAALYRGETLAPIVQSFASTRAWALTPSRASLDFWSEYLVDRAGTPRLLEAPRRDYSGRSRVAKVPCALFARMQKFAAERVLTLHQIALAAVALVLGHEQPAIDITMGAPYMNRATAEDWETVGLFLEPLPIRVQYARPAVADLAAAADTLPSPPASASDAGPGLDSPMPSPAAHPADAEDFVRSVAQASQGALAHALPWHQLQACLGPSAVAPLLDAMVTFLEPGQFPGAPLPGLSPLLTWSHGAKFKLMVEFMAVDPDHLVLRIEHDPTCVSRPRARHLERALLQALEGLVGGDKGLAEIAGEVAATMQQPVASVNGLIDDEEENASGSLFGVRLDRW